MEEREELEAIVTKNNYLPKKSRLSHREIAERMGVSPATISREPRAWEGNPKVDCQWREVVSYSAFTAQDVTMMR
ncbi:MAG: winged helix-turn-helix transcriptional regulator [Eubacteriales bacterium]